MIEAEGRKFAKILRSLEQFIQTEKCQNTIGIHMYWKNIGIQKHAGKVGKSIDLSLYYTHNLF